jgi:GNAT superfamily N-acetyltransferase
MQGNTRKQGFTIRFAKEEDSGATFGMVKELAEYENLLDKLKATEQLIREALFHQKFAQAVIAEKQATPVGFALFFYNFSSFAGHPGIYIEDLYVKPEMRGKGLGRALFAFLAKLALEQNCERLEWAVLKWNAPSIAFYQRLGAVAMDEWTRYKVTDQKLKDLAGDSAV